MSKKSRLKRNRRANKKKNTKKIATKGRPKQSGYDADFVERSQQLRDLYTRYHPEDVAVALGVSDLWIPNISSQVKHHFAIGVFAGIQSREFSSTKKIDSYLEFSNFIQELYTALPTLTMLEDFIPEADWGEVKVHCETGYLSIFYGGSVERISDFIEAFRILHAHEPSALNDMDCAIALQDKLISNINREFAGNAEEITPGHLEAPSETFWEQCSKALLSSCDVLPIGDTDISNELILPLGEFKGFTTWSSFTDAVMGGTSLPAIIINAGGKRVPISLRSATSVVIDYWAKKTAPMPGLVNHSIASFLSQRFLDRTLIAGPLFFVSPEHKLPYQIAAVVRTERFLHFILPIDIRTLPNLAKIEKDINKFLKSEDKWAMFMKSGQMVEFLDRSGSRPTSSGLKFHAVLTRVETSWMRLPVPDTDMRVISLPDFLTVFDSLDDADELDRFHDYIESHQSLISPIAAGVADMYGSFRDSNALLIEGALTPDMISLDPHWGSSWRYRALSEYWADVPPSFPDDIHVWTVDSDGDGAQRLVARGEPILAWGAIINNCTVYATLSISNQDLDMHNGRMLELFVHCLADALSQRKGLLAAHPIFNRKRITLNCLANETMLTSETGDENTETNSTHPLLTDWHLNSSKEGPDLSATVKVNLSRLQSLLDTPTDASFEVECVIESVKGLSLLVGLELTSDIEKRLSETASYRPRFYLKKIERKVDVPDFSKAHVPTAEQYKIARRDLAVVLKNLGVEPGRYELGESKKVIDSARDDLRSQVHKKIAEFDRKALVQFCIQQLDSLTSNYQMEVFRIKQSLEHDVSYDRSEKLAEEHKKFIREARNYRYLIECTVSTQVSGTKKVSEPRVLELVATIDWLFVLYGASDVLHNDIDVAGMEIDHSYVPSVYYSEGREAKEQAFALEMADATLGVNLSSEDEVNSFLESEKGWSELDKAFVKDAGFSLTHLLQTFMVLSKWQSIRGQSELSLSYQESFPALVKAVVDLIPEIEETEAEKLISFIKLDPSRIRILAGKEVEEGDVPVWEHNKRVHRYNLRPVQMIDEENLIWGAAAAERAAHIWSSSIFNGYLPADFNWKNVESVVRQIKQGLEEQLEYRAYEICSRATPWSIHGIDFKKRFSKENFDDVGDYDVLAYWPEFNLWLSVECKYNQPPYCLKDARRLRERIFGSGSDHGQFSKIEKRREFLANHVNQLRMLLNWPEPEKEKQISFREIYVSRDIYWWMRHPPYEVPTHFSRIDGLDNWLRKQGLLEDVPEI